jgi:hypothetical protein
MQLARFSHQVGKRAGLGLMLPTGGCAVDG